VGFNFLLSVLLNCCFGVGSNYINPVAYKLIVQVTYFFGIILFSVVLLLLPCCGCA